MSRKPLRPQTSIIPDLANPTIRFAFRPSAKVPPSQPAPMPESSARPEADATGTAQMDPAGAMKSALPLSAVRLDATWPEAEAAARARGLARPGHTLQVAKAELIYTTDGWRTTKRAGLQTLDDRSQGFLLAEVQPGTPVEYAVHAELQAAGEQTAEAGRAEVWLNNGGANYRGTAAPLSRA
jgi:hypothetical protein